MEPAASLPSAAPESEPEYDSAGDSGGSDRGSPGQLRKRRAAAASLAETSDGEEEESEGGDAVSIDGGDVEMASAGGDSDLELLQVLGDNCVVKCEVSVVSQ